jgi:D-inositol-3-phosphate glycosyltransferase
MKQDLQIDKQDVDRRSPGELADLVVPDAAREISVALLTGGGDRPYVFGLATQLISKVGLLDLIGSDHVDFPEYHDKPGVNFLNLRGDRRADVGLTAKVYRVAKYYMRLILYTSTASPRIFHILWNNKLEAFDRTLLMLYYRALGKKIVLTVHNVNAAIRDSKDSRLNRLTLRVQYRLADHIFVHTEKMKRELLEQFGVQGDGVTVIPFGINNAIPTTNLTSNEAKQRLGIPRSQKTLLFFGNIAPYKGLEYLITAFQRLTSEGGDYKLIIAGWPKNCEGYWNTIRETIREDAQRERILLRANYIPDEETETYFKAADVLVLPYRHIYQSGVLFLGYNFGLPVIAADVGSLKDEIVEGETGFVFGPEDSTGLARAIEKYFASDLYENLGARRLRIRDYAEKQHSWDIVGQMTMAVYADLLRPHSLRQIPDRESSKVSLDAKHPL